MAAIHVIFDRDNKVNMQWPEGEAIEGVYAASLDVGTLAFGDEGEIVDAGARLGSLLLKSIRGALETGAPPEIDWKITTHADGRVVNFSFERGNALPFTFALPFDEAIELYDDMGAAMAPAPST